MTTMRRSLPWLLVFVLCLVLGLAGGLVYAWFVAPRPATAAPDRLNPVDRDLYLRLVAAAYAADGDRDRAADRLAAAGPDAPARLSALLAADLSEGRPADDLAHLAADLSLDTPAVALLITALPLPPATAVAATVRAPLPTPAAAPVTVVSRQPLCLGAASPRLVVRVVDVEGEPLPGVALTAQRTDAAGDGATSTATTGFAAANDAGTANFVLQPGAVYALELDGQPVAEALQPIACPDGHPGGWEIELRIRE